MKDNKDLLNDLFGFFLKKYGKGKPFFASDTKGQVATIIELRLFQEDPKNSTRPALMLVGIDEDLVLRFVDFAPRKGFNEEFTRGIVEIHSTFEETNTLYVWFGGVLGGVKNILILSDREGEDEELSAFSIELLSRLNKIAHSGLYKITHQEKVTAH